MATIAEPAPRAARSDMFFFIMAIAMAAVLVLGFSTQLAMGRSSFSSPLIVHAHALVFFGWVVLYLLQNAFVVTGRMALHRTLGWIGAVWMLVMPVVGIIVTIGLVRRAAVPFFFTPGYFLIMDPVTVLTFVGLTTAAIVMRDQTEWHRRLHFCAMAFLTAPGWGRFLPVPFVIPWAGWLVFAAVMVFPLIGVLADLRRDGRVHPAWWWGIGTLVLAQISMDLISMSPLGTWLYAMVTAGSPGAAVAPLAYPPFPGT